MPAILNRGCVTPWLALMKPQDRTLIPQYRDIKQSNTHNAFITNNREKVDASAFVTVVTVKKCAKNTLASLSTRGTPCPNKHESCLGPDHTYEWGPSGILLIVQYKYLKSCSGDFNSPESDPPHKIVRYWFYYSI